VKISELRAEVSALEEQILELQRKLDERDQPENSSPKSVRLSAFFDDFFSKV
jgi:hypothetical protein